MRCGTDPGEHFGDGWGFAIRRIGAVLSRAPVGCRHACCGRLEFRLEGAVEAAELLDPRSIQIGEAGLRFYHPEHRRLRAQRFRSFPGCRHARQSRGSEGWSFVAALIANEWNVQDIGKDLCPEDTTGPAANQAGAGEACAGELKACLRISEAERDAFENGLDKIGLLRLGGEPEVDTPRVGIVVRRTLPGQIRQEEQGSWPSIGCF